MISLFGGVMSFAETGCTAEEPLGKKYIEGQQSIICAHVKKLVSAGRMAADFPHSELYLAEYGWHTGNKDGYFGAYTFSQRAFEQAQKCWFVHCVMKPDSDLLLAVNINAEFKHKIRAEWWGSGGTHEIDADPEMNSAVGYKVGFLYKGPEDATVVEVVDGRTLRLDKKATGDVLQYGVSILPQDYIDYCNCTNNFSPFGGK